jgi:hypothetical protein
LPSEALLLASEERFPSAASIVFASAAVPAPVALVGLNELGNLFVDAAGTWRADSYVPAYVRAFPFVIIGDPARGPSHVGIEEGAACLAGPGGEPLFEGGKPTAVASEAVKLAAATVMMKNTRTCAL